MAGCRAFIFPVEGVFGITPVGAQACGKPVIAYGAGGALSTVVEGATGLFFHEQTPDALANVVASFHDEQFNPLVIRRHAEQFDTARFAERLSRFISSRASAAHAL